MPHTSTIKINLIFLCNHKVAVIILEFELDFKRSFGSYMETGRSKQLYLHKASVS